MLLFSVSSSSSSFFLYIYNIHLAGSSLLSLSLLVAVGY